MTVTNTLQGLKHDTIAALGLLKSAFKETLLNREQTSLEVGLVLDSGLCITLGRCVKRSTALS